MSSRRAVQVEGTTLVAEWKRREPPESGLGEASNEQVRQCGRGLSVPGRCHSDAMHEVQVHAGIGAQCQEVVVVFGG